MPQPLSEIGEIDEYFKQAVEVVTQYERASASLIQRRLSIGYARSARVIDQLEAAGVVGPAVGAEPREVLIRDPKEIFGDNWEKLPNNLSREVELWTPEHPKSYKMPSNIKLSKVDDSPWDMQFKDAYDGDDFKESKVGFPLPLGVAEDGKVKTESLIDANNLIIAGNPLSLKENLVDTILLTYLLKYDPSKLKFILIDPTHYLDFYNGVPHLLSPVIHDFDKTVSAFKWLCAEMERRQKQFAEKELRDIEAFNEQTGFAALPRILTVTFSNVNPVAVEDALIRLTAQGSRTGIHSIVVTDHTSGTMLPNMLKSNIPARAVFRLTAVGDSRAIEASGAEKLETGELIYKPNYGEQVRLKAIFTPEVNVKEVVNAVKQ